MKWAKWAIFALFFLSVVICGVLLTSSIPIVAYPGTGTCVNSNINPVGCGVKPCTGSNALPAGCGCGVSGCPYQCPCGSGITPGSPGSPTSAGASLSRESYAAPASDQASGIVSMPSAATAVSTPVPSAAAAGVPVSSVVSSPSPVPGKTAASVAEVKPPYSPPITWATSVPRPAGWISSPATRPAVTEIQLVAATPTAKAAPVNKPNTTRMVCTYTCVPVPQPAAG